MLLIDLHSVCKPIAFYYSLLFPFHSPDDKLDVTGLLQKALARSQTMNLTLTIEFSSH